MMNHERYSEKIEHSLSSILTDNTSGAQALTFASCSLLISILQELPADLAALDVIEKVARTGRQIIRAQSTMAPLRHMLKVLLRHMEDLSQSQDIREGAIIFIERYMEWLREVKYLVAKYAAALIGLKNRIMTHSLSTLVLESFRLAKQQQKIFEVIATESRPVYEGRMLSRQLSQFGIPVTLIVDAAVTSRLENVDMIFLGADRITRTEFINKIGTLALVTQAHSLGKPCYVLAGSDKFLSEEEEPVTLGEGSQKEVWDDPPSGINVINPYFERIPLRLVTGIITETGIRPYRTFALQNEPFTAGFQG